MPALTLSSQRSLLPEPVIRELLAGDENRLCEERSWSVSICAYPEIVVIDGWLALPSRITGLKFSEVVPRASS